MAESMENAFINVCQFFGIEKLNKHQEDAIKYIVEYKKDLFVNLPTGFGKSLIFQALPLVFRSQFNREPTQKHIIIVVSPLTSLMKDQVSQLNSLGMSAVSLNDITAEVQLKAVQNGEFSIVFGSPELWLSDERWRKMVISNIYKKAVRAVAVDEAHVICHWGQSKSNKHAAFRVWFSRLHEFRSLLPGVPFIALTATATSDTRAAIFEALVMNKPQMIVESPNKENISYVVHYMQKNASLSDYFAWIADQVIAKKTAATRTIIYCQTIKQCAVIYSTLKTLLGDKAYEDPEKKDPERMLLEMLHSCTPSSNKEHILKSFQTADGCVRILVATIAFGMGVDCKQVYCTIHFGPAKNVEAYMQESGRAGRDGTQSTAYLLYQSFQLMHVEREMKMYIKSNDCRRKFLLGSFDVQFASKDPLHLCCDNCSLICNCGLEECKELSYPTPSAKPSPSEPLKEREVSHEQTVKLIAELENFRKGLLIDLLKRDASGKLKVFNHPKVLLGFSEIQISQLISHSSKLFTLDDICNYVEIWDVQHAHKIYQIMQRVFGNMDNTDTNVDVDETSSDEEDNLLPEDWNELGTDEELAMMAIDELSFFQMDVSNDDSFDTTSAVPFSALNALLNLSFDAVMDA